ncbi:carboxymuconolactone decarboxylase family protein [Pseudodesulfovibrio cashew]|uniref:Carboxymuconolactone decarboxylase family protein n=1 Tax=Pseudodesulfovibrio cashew TaxID=2678688 RepID=A0A6I6JSP6_9BACT|nr:carboxymuconolactone decarboxylase family protein [Pseudodesulfovibrio cashew]QGY40604.1 carboxymuconolactone decarboxylase family protein [Pseudodesulfovibrio cashew]
MKESQIALKESIGRHWQAYKDAMPEIADVYDPLPQEVYKDGVISARHKRLMALVGGLVHGCRGCILYQTENALELGASVEEICEACAVAVSLGGTMASAETSRVMAYLEEKGIL